ncbi:MAG: hypothetical protein J6N21_00290 [Butyrivibrio sp.]|nr:hypothetical protein [Butyrivibrio sp.]
MEIKEFGKIMEEKVKELLGAEYLVEYSEVTKNNGNIWHALAIKKKDENIAPSLYIDNCFSEYNDGKDVDMIAKELISLYKESAPGENVDVKFFTDFSKVAEKLTFKLVNYEKNKNMLKEVPYKICEDLALVPLCLIENKYIGTGSIMIKNRHLEEWEVSFDELWENVFERAVINTPVKISGLLENIMGAHEIDEELDYCGDLKHMHVLSNTSGNYGAAVIMYPGLLHDLSEKLGSDLIILPSSLHEVIVLECAELNIRKEDLFAMVGEVNRTVLQSEDILSDNIYHYSASKNKLYIYC